FHPLPCHVSGFPVSVSRPPPRTSPPAAAPPPPRRPTYRPRPFRILASSVRCRASLLAAARRRSAMQPTAARPRSAVPLASPYFLASRSPSRRLAGLQTLAAPSDAPRPSRPASHRPAQQNEESEEAEGRR
ncbi:hypothetical protein BRADI_2g06135v3, partial [Brachypodium distachyon]